MRQKRLGSKIEKLRSRLRKLEGQKSSNPDCSCCRSGEQATTEECANAGSSTAGISRSVEPDGQTVMAIERFPTFPRLPVTTAAIDASRDDNGFLGCCHSAYRTSTSRAFSHSNIEGAFSILRGVSTISSSILVGHGAPGFINLGTGQNAPLANRYMSRRNESEWATHASGGVMGLKLTLFGCEVAGGAEGAAFLQRVANRVRKPVGGWTGLVWCGGDGRVWGTGDYITARPGMRLEPVESPVMYAPTRNLAYLDIWMGDKFESIPLDDVLSAEFSPILGSQIHFTWPQGMDQDRALHQIDFEHPLVTDDKPASATIGQLILKFRTANRDVVIRPFRLLGASLLQDVHYSRVYYYTGRVLDHAGS